MPILIPGLKYRENAMTISETSTGLDAATQKAKRQSKFKRIERLIRQQKLLGIGVVVLVVLVFTAALPGVIATHHPHATNANAVGEAPSLQHWLGTDLFGRDVFSRIVYGTRTSLLVAFVSVLSAFAVGSFAGLIAGYIKGPIDHFLGRVMDVLFSLPPELLAIAVAGILGPNLRNTIIAISIVYVPHFFVLHEGLLVRRHNRMSLPLELLELPLYGSPRSTSFQISCHS